MVAAAAAAAAMVVVAVKITSDSPLRPSPGMSLEKAVGGPPM